MIGYSIISINTKSPTDPIAFLLLMSILPQKQLHQKSFTYNWYKVINCKFGSLSVTASIVDAVIPTVKVLYILSKSTLESIIPNFSPSYIN